MQVSFSEDDAILEDTQKQCPDNDTDGKEYRNSFIFFPSRHSILALFLRIFKDTAVSVAYGGC